MSWLELLKFVNAECSFDSTTKIGDKNFISYSYFLHVLYVSLGKHRQKNYRVVLQSSDYW